MGRAQTPATKEKLRKAATARKRVGGKFDKDPNADTPPFARFVNRGAVLRDIKIGKHSVRYWPPGSIKSVEPEGERDADAIEQLERVERHAD